MRSNRIHENKSRKLFKWWVRAIEMNQIESNLNVFFSLDFRIQTFYLCSQCLCGNIYYLKQKKKQEGKMEWKGLKKLNVFISRIITDRSSLKFLRRRKTTESDYVQICVCSNDVMFGSAGSETCDDKTGETETSRTGKTRRRV